jgi:hypothetical protein
MSLTSRICIFPITIQLFASREFKITYTGPYLVTAKKCSIFLCRMFLSMEELTADYSSGSIHPAGLKQALAKAINTILQVMSVSCNFFYLID